MLEEELHFAVGLAWEAGQEIIHLARNAVNNAVKFEYKENGELVSSIDKAVDALIREAIQRKYPCDGLLTEESADDYSRLEKERVWVIDPVDGTEELKEYLKNPRDYPHFAVHIGLAINGTASLGVVYAPVHHKTYFGIKGSGSFLVHEAKKYLLHASTVQTIGDALVGICSPKKIKNVAAAQAIGFRNLHYIQSLGVKACMIADGTLDAYLTVSKGGTKEWDTCAPSVIVEEAGGTITDCYGNSIPYNKKDVHNNNGVLITNGFLHDKIIQQMPRI